MSTNPRFRRAEPALVDNRRDPRHPVLVTRAAVKRQDRKPIEAVLRDVSPFGCRIACTTPLDIGETLALRLGGSYPVAANVVWVKEGQIGCRFAEPIDHGLMRRLIIAGV